MWTTEHIRKAQRISILLPRCYRTWTTQTWTTQTESSAHSRMQRQEVPRSASASAMTSTLYLRFSSSFYYGACGWLQSGTAPLFTARKSGVVAELGSSCRQSVNCSNWLCPFKFCEPQRKKKKKSALAGLALMAWDGGGWSVSSTSLTLAAPVFFQNELLKLQCRDCMAQCSGTKVTPDSTHFLLHHKFLSFTCM